MGFFYFLHTIRRVFFNSGRHSTINTSNKIVIVDRILRRASTVAQHNQKTFIATAAHLLKSLLHTFDNTQIRSKLHFAFSCSVLVVRQETRI